MSDPKEDSIKRSITDLKAFALEMGIIMSDQARIAAEVTETRAKQKSYSPEEIKENFDFILQDMEKDTYKIYLQHEEKYVRDVLEAFFQRLIDYHEISNLDDAGKVISGYFKVLDNFFLSMAQSRKSRAGKTFESIHNTLFKMLEYPFDGQIVINGKPDFLMPSARHYDTNPMECIIFTAKRTIRERWRQIVTEGTRGLGFYLATIDHRVTNEQLKEMLNNRIYLVVPSKIKEKNYSEVVNVLSFKQFFEDHLDPKVKMWKRKGIL